METLKLKRNWKIFKGNLKQKWADLPDDDLQYLEGRKSNSWDKPKNVPLNLGKL